MRIRTIKPEFWADAKMGKVPIGARLLFIGLWNFCDDYGVISASPRRILGEVFENDESVSEQDIKHWCHALEKLGFLQKFKADEKIWYFIKNWEKHQKIDKRSKRRNPIPTESTAIEEKDSEKTRESFERVPALEEGIGNREYGRGNMEEEKGKTPKPPRGDSQASEPKATKPDFAQDFEAWWSMFRADGRDEDRKAKGEIKKKYLAVRKHKPKGVAPLTFEEINTATAYLVEMNRGTNYPKGFRKFMDASTIRDRLKHGVEVSDQQKKTTRKPTAEDYLRMNMEKHFPQGVDQQPQEPQLTEIQA
jgi:hypothetical protein